MKALSYIVSAVCLVLSNQAFSTNLIIENVVNNKGKIYISLYNKESDYLSFSHAVVSKMVLPKDRTVTISLKELPAGKYAISGYHDINDNGELDFGGPYNAPIEPLLWGNNALGAYGMPSFAATRVAIDASTKEIRLSF